MNELALFAGVGGGILGGKLLGWRTVCAIEIDPYCRDRLMQRQNEGHLPAFPVWGDVRTFDGTAWRGRVDVVTAGFPCQPFSVAGKRAGEADDRNLWPDTIRIIREVGPRFALLENVPGLLAHPYFGTILGDLAESGYGFRWRVLSAAELGAPHRRDRLWIVGFANELGLPREHGRWTKQKPQNRRAALSDPAPVQRQAVIGLQPDGTVSGDVANATSRGAKSTEQCRQLCGPEPCSEVADAAQPRAQECESGAENDSQQQGPTAQRSGGIDWWLADPADGVAESGVGRVADGVPHRVVRLRALGNAQVPIVAATAWRLLSEGLSVGSGGGGDG